MQQKKRRDQLTHFLEWSWAEVKFNFSLSLLDILLLVGQSELMVKFNAGWCVCVLLDYKKSNRAPPIPKVVLLVTFFSHDHFDSNVNHSIVSEFEPHHVLVLNVQ